MSQEGEGNHEFIVMNYFHSAQALAAIP